MSTTTASENFEEMIQNAVMRERKRCIGLTLAAFGVCKLSGQEAAARVLDGLATKMEHEDWNGEAA